MDDRDAQDNADDIAVPAAPAAPAGALPLQPDSTPPGGGNWTWSPQAGWVNANESE